MRLHEEAALASILGSFGLSEYEARAYLALLRRGPLLVSDLAYHARIPRTKCYATLRGLSRKGLASPLPGKPIRYKALSPDGALTELAEEEERKAKAMKRALISLRKMANQDSLQKDYGQGRYLVLNPAEIPKKLEELLRGARRSAHLLLDDWCLKLFGSALSAIPKGLDARLLIPYRGEGSLPPDGFQIRLVKEARIASMAFIDDALLLADGVRGRGFLFQAPELIGLFHKALFQPLWEASTPLEQG